RQQVMVRSRPKRTARRGASGASRPMHKTGKAVVRLIRPRLSDSSAAMRSISGAKEVMPGRRLIAANTSASISRARDTGFTVHPAARRPIRPGQQPYPPMDASGKDQGGKSDPSDSLVEREDVVHPG